MMKARGFGEGIGGEVSSRHGGDQVPGRGGTAYSAGEGGKGEAFDARLRSLSAAGTGVLIGAPPPRDGTGDRMGDRVGNRLGDRDSRWERRADEEATNASQTSTGLPPGVLLSTPPSPVARSAQPPVAGAAGQAAEGGVAVPVSNLHLLVVDDDEPVRNACREIVRGMGFQVHTAESVPAARAVLNSHAIDLLLLDLKLPGGGGLLLLEEVKALHPATAVVVMTAYATVSSAVEAMRIGAADYLTKPFALDDLTAMLTRASERRAYDVESRLLRDKLRTRRADGAGDGKGNSKGDGQILGNSPEMERLYRILSKVAFTTHPVLILGESGTGKEMVARAIHFNGPNARKPFVPVDCGTLVPTLIESELFGYVKGAFTGANRSKEGLLAAAEGGTVFLDEIGELPLDLQAKLLRALQEKEVRPVGATYAVPISARVLAATNRNLALMVEQGRFRKDLYFRLNVVNLKIPALRARHEDIPMLAHHFLERIERETGRQHAFSDDALRLMTEYDWPGNVRELENAIERACALSSGPLLHMGDLPTQLDDFRRHQHQMLLDQRQLLAAQQSSPFQGHSADMQLDHSTGRTDTSLTQLETGETIVSIAELEKQAILNTIRQLHGDKLMAAKLLQIGKTTLYRKLKEYGIAEAIGEVH